MIASVLIVTSTTAVMTIATGVFIVISLLRIYQPSFRVGDEPALNGAAPEIPRCFPPWLSWEAMRRKNQISY
jgi:hypothetical protein